jgi:hypothetical protein
MVTTGTEQGMDVCNGDSVWLLLCSTGYHVGYLGELTEPRLVVLFSNTYTE